MNISGTCRAEGAAACAFAPAIHFTRKKGQTIVEFVAETLATRRDGACWMWPYFRNANGYGLLQVKGKSYLAHRYVYQKHFGVDPGKLCVMHTCDNPGCFNSAAHGRLGTQHENLQDMVQKGRSLKGKTFPNMGLHWKKISDDDVREMRRMYDGGATIDDVMERFGTKYHNTRMIVKRLSRKNVI